MKVLIYSRDNCIFCDRAKELLESQNIYYNEIRIGHGISRDELVEAYKHNFADGKVSVPIILIDNRFIGGYNELQQVLGGS